MPLADSNLEGFFTMESGGNQVSEDAPFHSLVIGNWSGNRESELDGSLRRPILIDRDNFDDVLRKINPRLTLEFDSDTTISLSFTELDDFHPDNIFRYVSQFENLRDVRRKLKNADSFNEAASEVRSWFSNTETVAEKPEVIESDDLLDQILSGNSVEASAVRHKSGNSKELSEFIGDIVKPHLISTDLEEQANLIAAVDAVVSDLMRNILHHKDFQELEAAWRGLYFLVRQTDTDTDLKIYILDLSKEELADDLKSAGSLVDTNYCGWIAGEELETFTGEPWAAVCGNYRFSLNVDDVAALMRISQISKAANTPFISSVHSEVLGVSSLADSPSSNSWNLLTESEGWKLWNTLRSGSESEYLGLAMPRFLGRLPYGHETDPCESFQFDEYADSMKHEDYLWINPAFLCLLLLNKSFRKNGWAMAENILREIDDLPMHIQKVNGETHIKPCAEITLTEAGLEKMVETGVMPLISFRDSDRIRVGSFQAISQSRERIRGRWY